jgi:sulfite reductase (ferredoxin)
MSTETALSPAAPSAPAEAVPKRSAVEGIKENSRQLRGTIREQLLEDGDHFDEQNKQLLKFHGSYQQEDRDARKNRKKDGVGKHYMFMVRCKIPAGKLTAAQYLAVDDLARAYGNGTLRFTTRQGIQLHGVLKSHLKDTITGINQCLLSTLGACGDVERNVMACPAPHYHAGVHAELQETAALLAAHLAPRTTAYHEIWLNGKQISPQGGGPDLQPAVNDNRPVVEPLYGKVYLPRKFKTGLALPEDNCIDVYAQDLGLLAIVENGSIAGYNVLVGGGMGMTHGNANTFPHLARPICYVPARAVVGAAEAVVKLFRDHGNRADRKRARIKYLVHDWGVEKFRQVLSEYIGGPLHDPRPVEVRDYDPHLGWHPQGNGKWYYGLSIENGRVKDEGSFRLRTALRSLVERFRPGVRLTPLQDILLCDLDASAKGEIDRTLAEHGVLRPDQISTVQQFSMACPAIPTCGLAISESERVLPALIDQLEVELKRLGLEQERLSVRMTGCPNGCARPYQSDIGLVGRSGDKFTVFVGGGLLGTHISFQLKDLVPQAEIVPLLLPLLEHFKANRAPREGFGAFCRRLGEDAVRALLPETGTKPVGRHQAVTKPPAEGPAVKVKANGDAHRPIADCGLRIADSQANPQSVHRLPAEGEANVPGPALEQPEARLIPLALQEPAVAPAAAQSAVAHEGVKHKETYLAGPAREERPDHTVLYNSDGSVRHTVVYFYGNDQRAGTAGKHAPLRRKAVYRGRVDPFRLHAARKLSDTLYVGPAGHERRDVRLEYDWEGRVARKVVFYYEGDGRAADVPSGAVLSRRATYRS